MLCLGQRSTPHGERRASTMRHDAAAAVARCRRATTRSHANSFFEQAGTRERALGYLSGEGAVAESRDERSDAVRVLADASTTPFFANSIFGLPAHRHISSLQTRKLTISVSTYFKGSRRCGADRNPRLPSERRSRICCDVADAEARRRRAHRAYNAL